MGKMFICTLIVLAMGGVAIAKISDKTIANIVNKHKELEMAIEHNPAYVGAVLKHYVALASRAKASEKDIMRAVLGCSRMARDSAITLGKDIEKEQSLANKIFGSKIEAEIYRQECEVLISKYKTSPNGVAYLHKAISIY